MGRSVYVPSDAQVVVFNYIEYEDQDDDWSYPHFVDWARDAMLDLSPSMDSADGWVGREGRILASNGHAVFGISEYCGCVALWLIPEENALAQRWCERMAPKFVAAFGALRLIGRASNGEAFFERVP